MTSLAPKMLLLTLLPCGKSLDSVEVEMKTANNVARGDKEIQEIFSRYVYIRVL